MEKTNDYLKVKEDVNVKKLIESNERILFSDTIEKFSPFGWKQTRSIVVTDKSLYNIKKTSLKRRIIISCISAITSSKDKNSQEFVLHIPSEYDYRYASQRKDELIKLIRSLYSTITGRDLPLYLIDQDSLKDFAASKSESKKGIFRLPDKCFLVEESPRKAKVKEVKSDDGKMVGLQDFKVMKKLSKGIFSSTFLVKKLKDSQFYVMKQINKSMLLEQKIEIKINPEKAIKERSSHPFLLELKYGFQDASNIYFVAKYYKGGELYNYLLERKRFTEDTTRFYAAQIALGLGELHDKKLIYRNLKPEKILIDEDGYLAIIDFEFAKILDTTQVGVFYGTAEYLAPEILNGSEYNKQVDWWAFGILIYEMLVGYPPFRCRNSLMLYELITKSELSFPDPKKVGIELTSEAKDIIMRLLKKKPEERLGAKDDINEVLSHSFFKSINTGKLLQKELVPEIKPVVTFDTDAFPDSNTELD